MLIDRFKCVKLNGYKAGKIIARMLYDHKNNPGENVNISEWNDKQEIVRALNYVCCPGSCLHETEKS